MSTQDDHPPTFRLLRNAPEATFSDAPKGNNQLTALYDVETQPIGRGGYGTVFRARSKKTTHLVAVKRLHPLDNVQKLRDDFKREVTALSRLQHPNIVKLLDFGEDQQGPYIVTEWVEGKSLPQLLERGPLELKLFYAMAIEICQGLEHAHKSGVLHLDIKPGNLLLDTHGHVRIVDLGISKLDSTSRSLSRDASMPVAGTPAYASPEQKRNDPDLDARSDIYSLGRTFHQLLTGDLPKAQEVVSAQLPPEVRELLTAMLRPDRNQRISRVSEIRRKLVRISRSSLLGPSASPCVDGGHDAPHKSKSGWSLRVVIRVSITLSLVAATVKLLSPNIGIIVLQFFNGEATVNVPSASTNPQPVSTPEPVRPVAPAPSPAPELAPAPVVSARSMTLPELQFVRVDVEPCTLGRDGGRANEVTVWSPARSEIWISTTETTQSQWQRVMNTAPWRDFPEELDGTDFPAVGMTFDEVLQFLDRLSKSDDATYDLPTEPEWETACRGRATRTSAEADQQGWTRENSGGRLHLVGQLPANSIGLYDLLGNAAEWTRDEYHETWRQQGSGSLLGGAVRFMTIRGGHWDDPLEDCQPWSRSNENTGSRPTKVGIRLVLRNISSKSVQTRQQ